MRLLIDQMYPPRLAEQLRRRGADVVAVSESAEWRSLADADIFALAQTDRRAIVTENIGDFVALADAAEQRRSDHFGLVLLDPAKFPRGRDNTIGRMVRLLLELLAETADDTPQSVRHWL